MLAAFAAGRGTKMTGPDLFLASSAIWGAILVVTAVTAFCLEKRK